MKAKLLILSLLLSFNVAVAQRAKVQAAYNYLKYEQLDKAKEAIDQVMLDEESRTIDKTWYYRGLIYESIYNSDKFRDIAPDALDISFMSYQKALAIDPNSEYKGDINTRLNYVKTDLFNLGVVNLRDKKEYEDALRNFESVLKIVPDDSSSTLYAAYAAERAKNNKKAIEYYKKVLALNNGDAAVYRSMITLYKAENDNDNALAMLQEARRKYPDDLDLILQEINVYLPQGKNKEAIDLLNIAVAKDPTNASLYFALGATYDKMSNVKDASGNYPAERKEYIAKATEAYKKTLENKPDNFEANYNLGALYFNEGAEMLSVSADYKDAKEYTAAKQRIDAVFSQALPYLEKALELNPKDHDTLISLKQLYYRQNNMEKYYVVKARLDAEGK